jgi:hypothetical protein
MQLRVGKPRSQIANSTATCDIFYSIKDSCSLISLKLLSLLLTHETECYHNKSHLKAPKTLSPKLSTTPSKMLLVLLFLFLATGSHAYIRFNTSCTVLTVLINFVSSPDSRGTLDILWSCLFTIITCTWTI